MASVQFPPGVKHTVNDGQLLSSTALLGAAIKSTSVMTMVQAMKPMHGRLVMGQNLRAWPALAWSLASFWQISICVGMEKLLP